MRSHPLGEDITEILGTLLLRVRAKSGELLPLRANRAQRKFMGSMGQSNIVLKARQMGTTTGVAARFFLRTITRPGTMTVLVAHDQASAEEIFKIVHRFWANLPQRLREGALRRGRANVRQITFPMLDSEYRVETAADPDAGRGLTIHQLHCSEVARWPGDAAQTLASLRAALVPAGEMVIESTAQGAGGVFYQEWKRAAMSGCTRHFFPWWWEESYVADEAPKAESLSGEELRLQKLHGLSLAQIGFRRRLQAQLGGLARQEFAEDAESCFLASGECAFDLTLIERRMRELEDGAPLRDEGAVMATRGLHRFMPAMPGREYIIGVDAAGGGAEGDYACCQVLDLAGGMQVAELHGHFSPEELAARAAQLGEEYNRALIAVERNNHGHAVLAHLGRVQQYPKLFEMRGQAGWATTAVTRPRMVALLGATLSAAPELFASRELLAEMRSFVRQKYGRYAAAGGAHDDRVMAMAVALCAREDRDTSGAS